MSDLTIRAANERARELFGAAARCETHRSGNRYERVFTIDRAAMPGTKLAELTIRFKATVPWKHVFDLVKGMGATSAPSHPEGTDS